MKPKSDSVVSIMLNFDIENDLVVQFARNYVVLLTQIITAFVLKLIDLSLRQGALWL